MAVGCISALILDNTIPGTPEERGIKTWRQNLSDNDSDDQFQTAPIEVYDLPFFLKRLSKWRVAKYLPFLSYKGDDYAITQEVESNGVKI